MAKPKKSNWMLLKGNLYATRPSMAHNSCIGCVGISGIIANVCKLDYNMTCVTEDIIWVKALPITKRIRHPKF